MSSPSTNNPDAQRVPFEEFQSWTNNISCQGQTYHGERSDYVPLILQRKYWTLEKIRAILFAANADHIDHQKVFRKQQVILSILVAASDYGRSPEYLRWLKSFQQQYFFDDLMLPFDKKPENLPDTTGDMWNNVFDAQWKFCPYKLGHSIHADSKVLVKEIFPFQDFVEPPHEWPPGRRHHGFAAKLKRMRVDLDTARQLKLPADQLVVLKSYGNEGTAWDAYKKEVGAYLHWRNNERNFPQETHILKCYGAFWSPPGPAGQLCDRNILIEHADRGTLHDMYTKIPPPRLLHGIKSFWESLANVLVALKKIHQEGGINIISIHQDLKPSNIFICSKAGDEGVLSQRNFNFVTKLGDFDRSHVMVSNHQSSNHGPDNGGSTTYSPPEMFLSEVVVSTVHSSIDIWAICCIFIEAAVWIIGGNVERDIFAKERRKQNLSRHSEVGRGDCFHNGNNPLPCVVDTLRLAREEGRSEDNMTPLIVELLLKVLQLRKPELRPEASELLASILKVLQPVQAPFQASTPAPTEHPNRIAIPRLPVDSYPSRPPPTPLLPGQGSYRYDKRKTLAEISPLQQPGRDTLWDHSERFKTPHAATTPVPSLRLWQDATDSTSGLNTPLPQSAGETSPTSSNTPQQEADKLAHYMDQIMSRTENSTSIMSFSEQQAPSMDTLGHRTSHANGSQGIPRYDTQRTASSRGLHRALNSQSRTSFQAGSAMGTSTINTGTEFAGPSNSLREVPAVKKEGVVLSLHDILDHKRKIMGNRQAEKPWRSEKFHFLRGRDHILLVDNSQSMQKYQKEVMEFVEGAAYFLEEADPDGVEVMLVCDTRTTLTKYKDTTELVKSTENDFAKGHEKECPMEQRLGFVLDEVRNRLPRGGTTTRGRDRFRDVVAPWTPKKKRPASIYVLTDGSWSLETKTPACGVDNPIKRIMKTMGERNSKRTDVSIQFVRYGNDPAGIQRLKYLDEGIAKGSSYDITDHKNANISDLWDVFVGPLDQENDRKGEDDVEPERGANECTASGVFSQDDAV